MSYDSLSRLLLLEASAGRLMPWLASAERTDEERQAAVDHLAELHRRRQLDVLAHLAQPSGENESHLDYAACANVLRSLLAVLDDDPGRIVAAAVALGTGLWEPVFHNAFLAWCAYDPRRIDGVLKLESRPDTPEFCLTAALIAALRTDPDTYLDIAVDYAGGGSRSRTPCIRAMAAMSVEGVRGLPYSVRPGRDRRRRERRTKGTG